MPPVCAVSPSSASARMWWSRARSGSALPPPGPELDWDTELAARTACPTHRKRLTEDERFARGRLTAPVPTRLLADARSALPALILHEGLHDVLNDAAHRTTAAAIVLWLERLRADSPILTEIQSGGGPAPSPALVHHDGAFATAVRLAPPNAR
ncbi:hypothetical protein [Streptomyces sp. ME19-01-6]|uniref:hypothetical protein n=1 Tax=Streptomyces sp. ME19-01-6 TaxID=3028686 RepID=UPI0029A93A39|nr:hypothetical protein [Streptomyces sp. ME19-01-6]MDX3225064.1 hypothetical protein [Streptomyces sp. ME19-01-6]